MPVVTVVRTYFQLKSPAALARRPLPPGVAVDAMPAPDVATFRALYRDVGARWHWHDRDAWPDAQLAAHLAKPGVQLLRLVQGDAVLGFAELERHDDGSVEIAYFGLVPDAIGVGLGGGFLTAVTERAFASGAARVWLHTCTLDHPGAIPNYERRGFTRYRQETYETTLPDD